MVAETMMLSRRQEDLRAFGEDGVGYYTTLSTALEAALEAGSEDWAFQSALAQRDRFFKLIWDAATANSSTNGMNDRENRRIRALDPQKDLPTDQSSWNA